MGENSRAAVARGPPERPHRLLKPAEGGSAERWKTFRLVAGILRYNHQKLAKDNDLSTGHSDPHDRDADNAKGMGQYRAAQDLVSPFMPLTAQT
jgi:hypothetical protein